MIAWLKRVWAWMNWEPDWSEYDWHQMTQVNPILLGPKPQPLTICTAVLNRPFREPR